MELIGFILIAGIWAAFLLPSFLEERRGAPGASTQAFARSRALLATVSVGSSGSIRYTSRSQVRRRQILVGLAAAIVVTLLVAVVTGSVLWLWITIGLDVVMAGYVTLLLMVKQQRLASRSVPRVPSATAPLVAPEVEDAPPTVRVIAG